MLSNPPGPKHKHRRTTRACDRCYRKACKCSPGIEGRTCARCEEEGEECTYTRLIKRRGPQPRRPRAESGHAASTAGIVSVDPTHPLPEPPVAAAPCTSPARTGSSHDFHFAAPQPLTLMSGYQEDVIRPEVVERLVQSFYYSAYPTRPYFHWPTYQAQVQNQLYRSHWGIFIVTMSVCAVSAARLSYGLNMSADPQLGRAEAAGISARCYAAAVSAMPSDITTVTDYFPMMKASAMLASVCLQKGDLRRTLSHLGNYISLSVLNGFYNEANWPANLTEIEKQERRRLFWGVYQQEQYVCNDFGFISRQREAQAAVLYPAEVFDDEDITETSIRLQPDRVSFLRGWNFCTDLYRLLEHMNSMVRARGRVVSDEPDNKINSFLSRFVPPKHFAPDSLHFIAQLYAELPPELKKVKAVTEDPQSDRYGFISCNILITTQILKMLLVGSGEVSVHQRCAIASELLDELSNVSLAFFHATSMASLRHLAHVGHMLASVIQGGPLSAWTYLQVRNVLLVLADFLEKIESARSSSEPILSLKLRAQIDRVDQCMKETSRQYQEPGLRSMGQSLLLGSRDLSGSPSESNVLPQNSPSRSVHSVSGAGHPPDHGGGGGDLRQDDLRQRREQHQQVSRDACDVPPPQQQQQQHGTLFQPPTFDFMIQPDHPSAFSLDPFESWPLSLDQAGSFHALGINGPISAAAEANGAQGTGTGTGGGSLITPAPSNGVGAVNGGRVATDVGDEPRRSFSGRVGMYGRTE